MRISIIIPAFNVEKYIVDCIESVLLNKRPEFELEVIVVDDGSTDKTYELIEKYIKDNFVKYFYQENSGQSSARNKGKVAATGDFILFVDSDDVIKPDLISKCLEVLNNHDVDVVAFDTEVFFENTDKLKTTFSDIKRTASLYDRVMTPGEFFNISVRNSCFNVQPYSYFSKSDNISELFFKEGIIYEDNLFAANLLLNSNVRNVICINEALYKRRVRDGSTVTMNKSDYHFFSYLAVYDYLLEINPSVNSRKMHSVFCNRVLALTAKEISLIGSASFTKKLKYRLLVCKRCLKRPNSISARLLSSLVLGKGYVHLVNYIKT